MTTHRSKSGQSRSGQSKPCASPMESHALPVLEYLRRAMHIGSGNAEMLHVIYLDRSRNYVADRSMGSGDAAALRFRMRSLFEDAVACRAHGMLIAHNHPSGDCRPSAADIDATRRLCEIAGALDIELVDHLILTERSAYSMRAGGIF